MALETGGIRLDELGLAARNHGMPLEALRWDVTPVGLHYLLIHYDIPAIDDREWSLGVDGAVARPGSFSLTDLRELPRTSSTVTLECAGNGRARFEPRAVSQPWLHHAVGTAQWTGIRLAPLLTEAGVAGDAVEVLFTGRDRGVEGGIEQSYQRSLPLDEAMREDVLIALEMNGGPLPPQHGAPARLIVPGWYGMAHVKWLETISVLSEPFQGYQQQRAYTFRIEPDDPGRPVTRMLPHSLVCPPGVPDFLSRKRYVEAGRVELTGRAWSGFGAITHVEVSTDGGSTWNDAEVDQGPGRHAWQRWRWVWEARPGPHVVSPRATDESGRTQPLELAWNMGGYEGTAVQRLEVEVR